MKSFNFAEVLSALNKPETKQLIETAASLLKLLPKFTVHELDDGNVAVLFDCTDENKARVDAIAAVFEDILPPFSAVYPASFDGDEKTYAALIFEAPQKEKKL